jgi:hypothetical protein
MRLLVNEQPAPTQRVSAIPFPTSYALPPKFEGPASAQDAHRQTTFVLKNDLRLFSDGMNLQLRILRDSSHSSFRKHPYAALLGIWSRTYSALSDGCLLATRASYESCPPLVCAASEFIAAQQELHAGGMPLFNGWLSGALRPDEEHKATSIGMGHLSVEEVLASDARLGAIYRPATELARPNFGATLLAVGPESNNQRLALAFADTTFHVGWAELTLGWLLALCERQLAVALHANDIFAIYDGTHAAYATFAQEVGVALARSDRCHIEEIDVDGEERYLVHNFRRQPSGAPRKWLL